MTAELCQKHAEEMTRVKTEMREELRSERERLLNQIRELTIMKERASAEVSRIHLVLGCACVYFIVLNRLTD